MGKQVKEVCLRDFVVRVDSLRVVLGPSDTPNMYLEQRWEWVIIKHPNLQKTVALKTLRGGVRTLLYLADKVYLQLDQQERVITVDELRDVRFEVSIKDCGRLDLVKVQEQGELILSRILVI